MKTLRSSRTAVGNGRSRAPSGNAFTERAGERSSRFNSARVPIQRLAVCCAMVLIPCAILAGCFYQLPEPTRAWWLGESGPVELASAWGYVLLAIGLLAVAAMRFVKSRTMKALATRNEITRVIGAPVLLAGCVAALAAREFDWHNIWTTRCVLKTRFYVDPAISAEEKLAASLVLCLIGYLLVITVRAYRSRFLDQLRRGQTAAFVAATGIVLLPLSKALDSGPSIFERFLPADTTNMRRFLGSFEEIMELAIPALFITAAIIAFWPRQSNEVADHETSQQSAGCQTRRAA